ncbi:MAG: tetratricopeptide repeat protein [Brasilonema octagenarum HA4186-MV1]|jgi:tetratricopeptide (TPR) repeat protein|nr:tetratricopeptide repeat protein [Brasilonema octagenarum HA4186-MV1]
MSKIKPEVAKRRIESFEKRFGKAHLYLAYHAAFPLSLTPDLLYRLWANFQRDIHGEVLGIPWIAVADLLLSSLCDEVGHELYEMNLAVRNLLLSQLKEDEKFGQQRIHEISEFLLNYVQQQLLSDDPDIRDFAQAQQWTALAYVRPKEASRELALALSTAYQNDRVDLLRLASLVETLAEPLTEFEEFQPLLIYARDMASFAHGNQKDAEIDTGLLLKIVAGEWGDGENKKQPALQRVRLWRVLILLIAVAAISVVVLEFINPFLRPLYNLYQGSNYLNLREPEKALNTFQDLITIKPNSVEAWKGRGDALLSLGRLTGALGSYNKALQIEPNNFKALNNKGKVLSKLGRYQEALEAHEKVLKENDNDVDAWSGKGKAYLGLRKYKEALDAFEKVKERRPDIPYTWQEIAFAIEIVEGSNAAKPYFEEALEAFEAFLKQHPQDPIAWTGQGSILQKLNRSQEALISYQKALDIDKNFYEALMGKGIVLSGSNPQEALVAFDRASQIRPDDYQVWYNRGTLLAQHFQKNEEALQSLDKAIAKKNDFSPAWLSKGIALSELKRYNEALAALDKAKELEPKNPYPWYYRGDVLQSLGKKAEAQESYNKAVELGFPRDQLPKN